MPPHVVVQNAPIFGRRQATDIRSVRHEITKLPGRF